MANISQFLKEVRIELAKVSWPNNRQMIGYTLAVIGLSAFVAIYLGALDLVFKYALDKILLR